MWIKRSELSLTTADHTVMYAWRQPLPLYGGGSAEVNGLWASSAYGCAVWFLDFMSFDALLCFFGLYVRWQHDWRRALFKRLGPEMTPDVVVMWYRAQPQGNQDHLRFVFGVRVGVKYWVRSLSNNFGYSTLFTDKANFQPTDGLIRVISQIAFPN